MGHDRQIAGHAPGWRPWAALLCGGALLAACGHGRNEVQQKVVMGLKAQVQAMSASGHALKAWSFLCQNRETFYKERGADEHELLSHEVLRGGQRSCKALWDTAAKAPYLREFLVPYCAFWGEKRQPPPADQTPGEVRLIGKLEVQVEIQGLTPKARSLLREMLEESLRSSKSFSPDGPDTLRLQIKGSTRGSQSRAAEICTTIPESQLVERSGPMTQRRYVRKCKEWIRDTCVAYYTEVERVQNDQSISFNHTLHHDSCGRRQSTREETLKRGRLRADRRFPSSRVYIEAGGPSNKKIKVLTSNFGAEMVYRRMWVRQRWQAQVEMAVGLGDGSRRISFKDQVEEEDTTHDQRSVDNDLLPDPLEITSERGWLERLAVGVSTRVAAWTEKEKDPDVCKPAPGKADSVGTAERAMRCMKAFVGWRTPPLVEQWFQSSLGVSAEDAYWTLNGVCKPDLDD